MRKYLEENGIRVMEEATKTTRPGYTRDSKVHKNIPVQLKHITVMVTSSRPS